jgi:ribosomal protein L40E
MFIEDITPATDDWAKNYAHMEYMRIVDHDLWNVAHYIEVQDDKIYTCMTCGALNTFWEWNCERCDALAAMAEDESQQA